jgi:hypothetical protein
MYGSAALPQNIRFERDPAWRTRAFTMQAAHDRSHWFWQGVFALLILSDLAWFFVRIVR